MYCPECGSDAADAKFCPECGNDLTVYAGDASRPTPGVCPECGTEAGTAKFCPECGHQMAPSGDRPARQPRQPAPPQPRQDQPRQQRRQAARRAEQRRKPAAPAPAAKPGRGRSPALFIWGGFAVAAVVVVLIIVGVGGGGGGGGTPAGTTSDLAPVVTADTAGSYTDLVTRANGLYDQGSAAFDKNDTTGGQKYFAAAAKVYAAAWKKQATDPGVGTDYATALFYSGQTDKALSQVEEVLAADPGFQTAYLNKGIFLKAQSTDAKDAGDSATADTLLAGAKAAFEKAVSLGASSDPGKRAAQELQSL